MKKVLTVLAAAVLMAACSNGNKVESSSPAATGPLITDREFDRLEAPKMDYESNISYEEQLKSSGTFVKGIKGVRTPTKTGSK